LLDAWPSHAIQLWSEPSASPSIELVPRMSLARPFYSKGGGRWIVVGELSR
jgi:hypothetical protein